ncbi:MAG TPA: GNAT family N-acetyltransferase [Lacibacter sp.]|nr:GNAT family N-acetyltransferase [Lacibacter sp.]HMO89970.1 GNAT family N-acetyltransferase [Lacibacter sp.]
MIIRKATTEDIPAIVQLLKASLGDVSSEKSVAYWNWKHVTNPFGPSPVLVAEEEGQLIGVRALMRWDWQEGDRVYRALRAVDTATHPEHQGKGIFKKLTLQLVEAATEEGYDFIFNSPNTQSTPGYLKMGWEVWGKMPLWLGLGSLSRKFQPHVYERYHQQLLAADLAVVNCKVGKSVGLRTKISASFLQWRYQQCPVKEYAFKTVERGDNRIWLFFSVKSRRFGMELRICHFFFSREKDYRLLFTSAGDLAADLGCRVITIAGLQQLPSTRLAGAGYFNIRRKSVQLTIRELANPTLYQSLKANTLTWLPESGDIELF